MRFIYFSRCGFHILTRISYFGDYKFIFFLIYIISIRYDILQAPPRKKCISMHRRFQSSLRERDEYKYNQ